MRRCTIVLALMATSGVAALDQAETGASRAVTVASPDGRLVATVAPATSAARAPWRYRLDRVSGATRIGLLGWSPLGVVRADTALVDLALVSTTPAVAVRERYGLPHGKRRVREHAANERRLTLAASGGARLELTVRVADDGLAFRYAFPETAAVTRRVVEERTGFAVPAGSRGWLLPFDAPGRWTPAYEALFAEVVAGAAAPSPQGWGYPALFEVGSADGEWLLITEAAVGPAYAGTRLAAEAAQGVYRVRLPDKGEGMGQGAVEPEWSGAWTLPWRVVIAGDLGRVFGSTLVEDLSPPVEGDFSWVAPGRASFGWWIDDDASKKEEVLKAFIDLAAGMGWEYSLIDANWHLAADGVIDRVVAYANERQVGLWLWYNSGGPHNDVTEWGPRDRITDPAARRAEFARLKALGIAGVKVDFWHSDKQSLIALYHDMLRDAAAARLLMAFHGATTPRGWARTFPNLLSVEAVFGAEQYKYNERYARDAAWHHTILPFTRNVLGAMDYLPVAIGDAKYPHQTTSAHELALAVLFESGVVHFPDSAERYHALPPAARDFLKAVPVAWDDSRLLDGRPGRLAMVARRRGAEWWVAAVNGQPEAATAAVDLSFLGEGTWTLTMTRDGGAPGRIQSETADVRAADRFNVPMLPRGGFLMRLARQSPPP
jgi:hypothetical protein